jgi:hypothetical protein
MHEAGIPADSRDFDQSQLGQSQIKRGGQSSRPKFDTPRGRNLCGIGLLNRRPRVTEESNRYSNYRMPKNSAPSPLLSYRRHALPGGVARSPHRCCGGCRASGARRRSGLKQRVRLSRNRFGGRHLAGAISLRRAGEADCSADFPRRRRSMGPAPDHHCAGPVQKENRRADPAISTG